MPGDAGAPCATKLHSGAEPFVPRPTGTSDGSGSTTASGCSSPRGLGEQAAPCFQAPEFPVPLKEKNTFLDFDVICSPTVAVRRAKTAPSVIGDILDGSTAAASGKLAEHRTCWADTFDDEDAELLLPSLGSAGHDIGECRPCAFIHKQRGCSLAAGCPFCHLCGAGEKRRRQKEKKAAYAQHASVVVG